MTLAAFALRLHNLSYQSLWRDEVDSLLFASRDVGTALGMFARTGENGPLYFLLLRTWLALAGDSEFALRYSSLLFGVLIVPLAAVLGRRLLGKQAGLGAALLAAVSPYYVWYSQEARMYALFAFLAALSLHLYLQAWEKERAGRWAIYCLVTAAGLYVHLFWALVILLEAALALPLAVHYGQVRRGFLWAVAVLVLPYLPLAAWEVPVLLRPPPSAYPFQPAASLASLLLSAFTPTLGLGPGWVASGLFLSLVLLGALRPGLRPHQRGGLAFGTAIVLLSLLLPLVVYYVVSLRLPLFTERYLIMVALPFYLLAGGGLAALRRRSAPLATLALLAVLWTSGYSLAVQAQTPLKSDFRAAAAFFATRARPDDLVLFVMPYVRHTFAYYYRGNLAWRDPPYTNGGAPPAQVRAELAEIVAGRPRVWLLLSEAEWHDARGLVQDWLDHSGHVLAQAQYARVSLYLYELPAANP